MDGMDNTRKKDLPRQGKGLNQQNHRIPIEAAAGRTSSPSL
jgi:hypothetical protein